MIEPRATVTLKDSQALLLAWFKKHGGHDKLAIDTMRMLQATGHLKPLDEAVRAPEPAQ
jgi:hypothetical protein